MKKRCVKKTYGKCTQSFSSRTSLRSTLLYSFMMLLDISSLKFLQQFNQAEVSCCLILVIFSCCRLAAVFWIFVLLHHDPVWPRSVCVTCNFWILWCKGKFEKFSPNHNDSTSVLSWWVWLSPNIVLCIMGKDLYMRLIHPKYIVTESCGSFDATWQTKVIFIRNFFQSGFVFI